MQVGEVARGGGVKAAGLETAETVALHRLHQHADVRGGVG